MVIKRGILVCVCFFVLIFFIASVSSLGVSPPKYEFDFEPGLESDFYFYFISKDPETEYVISTEGNFSEYVKLSTDRLNGSGRVDVHLKLPEWVEMPPGRNRIFVRAEQAVTADTATEGAILGAVVSIRGAIDIFVPYPGKYADVKFEIENANEGEQARYKLDIYSRGDEEITTNSRIEVYDTANNLVGTFSLGTNLIPPAEHVEINSQIDTSSFKAGNYKAVAVVSYSGVEKSASDDFRLGELYVGIVNYTRVVEKEKINPFYVDVESFWNENIENVFVEVSLIGKDVSFLTPSITLPKWREVRLLGHLDTTGIEEDNVQAKIVVHYEDKTTEETVDLELVKGKLNINYWLVGLIIVIIILIAFLAWIVLKLKKLEKKREKKEKKK